MTQGQTVLLIKVHLPLGGRSREMSGSPLTPTIPAFPLRTWSQSPESCGRFNIRPTNRTSAALFVGPCLASVFRVPAGLTATGLAARTLVEHLGWSARQYTLVIPSHRDHVNVCGNFLRSRLIFPA
jgi:hypothetical protein